MAPLNAQHDPMQIFRLAPILALLLALAPAAAAPAPYFQWRSLATGQLACSQTPLGEGWQRASGPYRDARCEKPMVVK